MKLCNQFLRYLIGRQLVNYGAMVTEERSYLAVPVQETGLQ